MVTGIDRAFTAQSGIFRAELLPDRSPISAGGPAFLLLSGALVDTVGRRPVS